MAQRNKGTFKFAASLEVQAASALDPRIVVEAKADLINKETWPYEGDTLYLYDGLVVAVKANKSIFMLVDKTKALDVDYSGWKQLDVSAAVTVDIIDNLTSQATNAALSANQGYILNQKIDDLGTKLSAVYSYRGTKETYAELEAIEDPALGDVWNVDEAHDGAPAGTNYAWNGTAWDALGGSIDLSKYYTKDELDSILVKKTDDGNTALEGDLVVEHEDGTKTTVLSVAKEGEDNVVKVGDIASPLELVGSENRPTYNDGENKSELALASDVTTAANTAEQNAKDYADTKFGEIDLTNVVEKEDGKELIPTEKLQLIDDNATSIGTLRTDVDKAQADVDALAAKAASIDADTVVTGVGTATSDTEKLTVEFNKAVKNTDTNDFVSSDEKLSVILPAASTTQAGVLSAADKQKIDAAETSITTLNSTTEGLTSAVNKLNGDDTVEGSVKNLAKAAAEKAVSDGMEWIEVVPEIESED